MFAAGLVSYTMALNKFSIMVRVFLTRLCKKKSFSETWRDCSQCSFNASSIVGWCQNTTEEEESRCSEIERLESKYESSSWSGILFSLPDTRMFRKNAEAAGLLQWQPCWKVLYQFESSDQCRCLFNSSWIAIGLSIPHTIWQIRVVLEAIWTWGCENVISISTSGCYRLSVQKAFKSSKFVSFHGNGELERRH